MNLLPGSLIVRFKIPVPWSQKTPTRTKISLRFIAVLLYATSCVAVMHHSGQNIHVIRLLWAWSESLISMLIILHGFFTRLGKKTWLAALLGQGAALASLWPQRPELPWIIFDAFSILLIVRYIGKKQGGFILASLLGVMSSVAGLLIGHQNVNAADEAVLAAIPFFWAQAHIQSLYFLWHSLYCQKMRMSVPVQEERLKSRALIWSIFTTLLTLVPYYLDPSKRFYLLGTLVMSIGYLSVSGISVISSLPQRTPRLIWRQYISEFYLMGIFTLLVTQYG